MCIFIVIFLKILFYFFNPYFLGAPNVSLPGAVPSVPGTVPGSVGPGQTSQQQTPVVSSTTSLESKPAEKVCQ